MVSYASMNCGTATTGRRARAQPSLVLDELDLQHETTGIDDQREPGVPAA